MPFVFAAENGTSATTMMEMSHSERNTVNQKRQPKGIPVGGEFAANEHDEAMSGLGVDLSTQEPPQIDDRLAELYYEDFRQEDLYLRARASLDDSERFYARRNREVPQSERDRAEKIMADATAERERLSEEMQPYHDEFAARGGWDRAYLVAGADGHVHSSTECSTCNRMGKRTRFLWMTEYSGKSESEIIDAAGSSACTVCYPNAPVDTLNRPSRILDPEYEAEKTKRAEEKAKRDAIAAEKGISDPETGDRLVVDRFHIKTAVTAEREALDRMLTLKVNSVRPYGNAGYADEQKPGLRRLVNALSNKRGETTEETMAYLEEKAAKKFKKDYGWVLEEVGTTDVPATPDFWED